MEFKITKEQIDELARTNAVIKERLNEYFPEVFKTELEIAKWYKYTPNGNIIYCSKIGHDGTLYGYGFISGQFKIYEDEKSGYCVCNSLAAESLIQATPEEVEAALINEAKKRGYKPNNFNCVLFPGHTVYLNSDELHFEDNRIRMGCLGYGNYLFSNGEWAEILPTEKTVITRDKALKILAKKLKVSPENIEIK